VIDYNSADIFLNIKNVEHCLQRTRESSLCCGAGAENIFCQCEDIGGKFNYYEIEGTQDSYNSDLKKVSSTKYAWL
jgi:hypothetical protein